MQSGYASIFYCYRVPEDLFFLSLSLSSENIEMLCRYLCHTSCVYVVAQNNVIRFCFIVFDINCWYAYIAYINPTENSHYNTTNSVKADV